MGTYLDDILAETKKQQDNVLKYVVEGVGRNEKWIREAIRKRWLLGKRPDGRLIGIYAWRGYADDKHRQNPLAGLDHVDLTLSGSLGKGIKVSYFSGTDFEIYSTDAKYDKISDMFGDVNFNLSEAEKEMFFDVLGSEIMDKIAYNIYG